MGASGKVTLEQRPESCEEPAMQQTGYERTVLPGPKTGPRLRCSTEASVAEVENREIGSARLAGLRSGFCSLGVVCISGVGK